MNNWQIVHSDGEIDDIDDASSVSSGWSVMGLDEVDENVHLGSDPLKLRSNLTEGLRDNSHPFPTSRLARGRRRGGKRRVSEAPSALSSTATFVMGNGCGGTNSLMSGGHMASNVLRSLSRAPITSTSRYNGAVHFNRHTTALHTDRQHAKCLIGGAMTSRGYQRQQQFRTTGGQVLRGHKAKL